MSPNSEVQSVRGLLEGRQLSEIISPHRLIALEQSEEKLLSP